MLHDSGHPEFLMGALQPLAAPSLPHQTLTSVHTWVMDHIDIP